MGDFRKSAMIWALFGFVTAPNVFFVSNWARFQSPVPDGDNFSIAYPVAFLVTTVLVVYAYRQVKAFPGRKFDWNASRIRALPTFLQIVVLELVSHVLWYLSDFGNGLAQHANVYEVFRFGNYYFTLEEALYVCLLLLTLPLALRLVRAYFDFLVVWVSACAVFLPNHTGDAETPGPREADANIDGDQSATERFEATIEHAIFRAGLRGYFAMACMIVTVVIALISFQYVFQTSATTRANQLITDIENTPIAFSGSFMDVSRDLKRISDTLYRSALTRNQPTVVTENTSREVPEFSASSGESVKIDEYLRTTIVNLQNLESTEGALNAEADEFLAKIANLKREMETASRTNWDVILVRTAIILLALVAVKIFHSVMMTAYRERHIWETKLAALRAVKGQHLNDANTARYLAIVGDEQRPGAESGPNAADLPIDVDRLVQKITDALARKI